MRIRTRFGWQTARCRVNHYFPSRFLPLEGVEFARFDCSIRGNSNSRLETSRFRDALVRRKGGGGRRVTRHARPFRKQERNATLSARASSGGEEERKGKGGRERERRRAQRRARVVRLCTPFRLRGGRCSHARTCVFPSHYSAVVWIAYTCTYTRVERFQKREGGALDDTA